MDAKILKEYAEIKLRQKIDAARLLELNPVIVESMVSEGVEKIPTTLGNFSFTVKKRWTYSPAVTAAEEVVDKLKMEEEQLGRATSTEQRTLMFTTLKEKKGEE